MVRMLVLVIVIVIMSVMFIEFFLQYRRDRGRTIRLLVLLLFLPVRQPRGKVVLLCWYICGHKQLGFFVFVRVVAELGRCSCPFGRLWWNSM
jgi:hypothetical protein